MGASCTGRVGEDLAEHRFEVGRVYVGSGGERSTVACATELDGRLARAEALAEEAADFGAQTLIGVGGGRVIDTVKLAAARTGAELLSVPTAISHDGISSPVASLFGEDGRRDSHAATMPAGIVVDLSVIGSAPARTLRAGLGDLVSNMTAILDWRLAQRSGHERFDAYPAMIAENAARSTLELSELESPESRERLAKGLLMSGLAMAAAGTSRPCSGAEHLISHALDDLLEEDAAMHGEQVALGTLVSAAAHESPLLGTLRALYSRLGLPTDPSHLSISAEDMLRAVQIAPQTRPERYTILSGRQLTSTAVAELLATAFAEPL